jgi:hypothetical protein
MRTYVFIRTEDVECLREYPDGLTVTVYGLPTGPDARAAYRRKYAKRPEVIAKRRAYAKRRRAEKRAARNAAKASSEQAAQPQPQEREQS